MVLVLGRCCVGVVVYVCRTLLLLLCIYNVFHCNSCCLLGSVSMVECNTYGSSCSIHVDFFSYIVCTAQFV